MTTDIQIVTTLPELAASINQEHAAVVETATKAVDHARRCGELLRRAKAQLQHGEWGPWLEANCQFSDRTARAYMRIAKKFPTLNSEIGNAVAEMPLRDALAAIADERSELDKARLLDAEGELIRRDITELQKDAKGLESMTDIRDVFRIMKRAEALRERAWRHQLEAQVGLGRILAQLRDEYGIGSASEFNAFMAAVGHKQAEEEQQQMQELFERIQAERERS